MTDRFGNDMTSPHVILTAGMQISQYKIIEKIGSGGMGEVYLAADDKLDRRVALKFLPAQFASDADFVSRFKREAQAAAKLEHPNIVTVYEVGEFQGRPFFAMQYVEGRSLTDLAHETTLSLSRIIDLAIQILEGLQRAHQAGIIHRDIKSANILVDGEQRPKILDFGLATIEGGERLTKIGSTIGTVAYMSPEQAQGIEVDQRSDLFSFGIVLYELIAARTPFKRDSDAATLRAITEDTAEPLARYRANMPDELQRIVTKLLERDPSLRYQTASGVISDLKKLAISGSSGSVQAIQKKPNRALLFAGAIVILALVVVVIWSMNRPSSTQPITEQALKVTSMTNNGKAYSCAISPDGKYLVYAEVVAGKQSLWVRQVATSSNVQILPPAENSPNQLIFSPDGNFICYTANDKAGVRTLYQLPVLGGEPKAIVSDVGGRACWSPDGKRLAFTRVYQNTGDFALMIVDADGSNEKRLIGGKGEFWYSGATSWSPDGKQIAVVKGMWKPQIHAEIAVIRVEDGAEIWTTSGNWSSINTPTWEKDGRGLLFCASERGRGVSQLLHVSYPGNRVTPITRDLAIYYGLTLTGDNNLISVIHQESRFGVWLVPEGDLGGEAKQITFGKSDGISGGGWMPDGRIMYSSQTDAGVSLWSANDDGSGAKQVIAGAPMVMQPQFTPDGRYIVFVSLQAGVPNIWRSDVDGQNAKQLTSGGEDYSPSISPDGKWVVFDTWRTGPDLLAKVSIDGGEPQILSQRASSGPSISPDGKWIAYSYQQQSEPYRLGIMPFDRDEQVKSFEWPVTANPNQVIWNPAGTEVYYVDTRNDVSNIWSLDIGSGATKQVTKFKVDLISGFAWSPDHKKLVLSRGSSSNDIVLFGGFK